MKKVLSILLASAGGSTLPESWNNDIGASNDPAWCSSTARTPDYWGSIHSTTPTPDAWKYLNIYVGNM